VASLSQGRTAAAQCGLFTYKSVPVIFEPPCISHAQKATAIHPTVFLAGIHRLLLTHKGVSAFPSANNCQGELQTPQSVPVLPSSIDFKNECGYCSPYVLSWCGQGQLLPL